MTPEQTAKRTAYMQEWRARNREHYNTWSREWQRKKKDDPAHKAARKRWYMQGQYGISPEDYDRMLEAQNFGCAICGTASTERRLNIDHCHRTGAVRGLLCTRCNTCLAWFEDHSYKADTYLRGMVW